MAETLTISDGTTTIDFLGSNYEILHEGGWSPKRAQLRKSLMGGQSPYHNVVERMAIKINGTSESDVLDKLQDLSDLFDQVDRWAAGGVVTAVYIEYEPSNTGLGGAIPQAVIVGPEPGTDYIQLPSDFTYIYKEGRYQLGTNIDPIIITFMRRPLWLYATEAKSSAASSGNPAVMTVSSTFTDTAKVFMPYDLLLVSSFDTTVDTCNGYVITTNDTNLIQYFEAEDMSIINATYQTDQVVATASNGNISEIDGDLPTAQTGALEGSLSSPGDALLWGVFCSVKNLSSSYPWRIRGGFYSSTLSAFVSPTPWKTLNESDYANPTPIFLGYVSTPSEQSIGSIFVFRLEVEHDDVGVDGTDDLQIDYACIVGIDESTNIIKVDNIFVANAGDNFVLEHRLDSHIKPWAWAAQNTSGPEIYSTVDGNKIFSSLGNSISCIVLANDGAGQWVHEDNLGEANITLTATRHRGYLTPL